MSALTRGFFHLHTAYLAMQEMWRRPTLTSAIQAQRRCLKTRLSEMANTAYGKAVGISAGMDYREFANNVPCLSVARLDSLVGQMRSGEANLLVQGRCTEFIRSSRPGVGTTFPLTQTQRFHLRRALQLSLGLFNARIANSGAWHGRCLFLDRPNLGNPNSTAGGDSSYSLCTALHSCTPSAVRTVPRHPGNSTRQEITMVLAPPERLLADPQIVQNQQTSPWPHLACWIHLGGLVQPYTTELRQRLGAKVPWHDIYGGVLGLFAAQDRPTPELRLLSDTGIFFEFCKAEEAVDNRSNDSAARLVTLESVEVGVDYALFVTTPSGICRFPTGDVIRFVGLNPPRLVVQGKVDEVLDAAKEGVRGRDCAIVLESIAEAHGWSVIHFHVAASEQRSLLGQSQICHEWWIELQPGTATTPTGPVLSKMIDAELMRLHTRYAERRNSGALQVPIVRLLMPGTFGEWLKSARLFRAQTPACRSDRTIADALARLARFYA